MTDPFLGEIQLLAFDFPPAGWMVCNGATLPINQYTALFSLIGITYGGNGTSTFQLPNLSARASTGSGQGPGLTNRQAGDVFGSADVALQVSEAASHTHPLQVFQQTDPAKRTGAPANGSALTLPGGSAVKAFAVAASANAPFAPTSIGPTGDGTAHENRQPFLALNYCIALQGTFPQFD